MDGGDFLRLLLWEGTGLASKELSRLAGNTVSGELEERVSSEGEVGVLLSQSVATESLRMLLLPRPLMLCFCLNFSSQPGLLTGFAVWVSGPGIEAK
jgi:hypothetical protein